MPGRETQRVVCRTKRSMMRVYTLRFFLCIIYACYLEVCQLTILVADDAGRGHSISFTTVEALI